MTGPMIQTYASRAALADRVADLLADRLRARIGADGRACLAVPGGTTPGPMLEALGALDLDWANVTVTLTDERWVRVSSEQSNQRLLAKTLLQGPAERITFVPLYTGDSDPAQGIERVCAELRRAALPLDIAVLGMGADMHTASLFPGAADLGLALAPNAPPAVAIRLPSAGAPRITLSAWALNEAERHILIVGASKRAALERALQIGDPLQAPVCAVLDEATVHYAD